MAVGRSSKPSQNPRLLTDAEDAVLCAVLARQVADDAHVGRRRREFCIEERRRQLQAQRDQAQQPACCALKLVRRTG